MKSCQYRRNWRTVSVGLVLGLVITACTSSDGDGGGHRPSADRIRIEPTPLWTGGQGALPSRLTDVTVVGESLVIQGGSSQDRTDTISVVDPATGEVRWSLTEGDSIRGDVKGRLTLTAAAPPVPIVGTRDGWGVLVPYASCKRRDARCASSSPYESKLGVARLSGTDGGARWATPVVPMVGSGGTRLHQVLAADERLVVSTVTDGSDVKRLGDLKIVASAGSDGAPRWVSSGMWPRFVIGDRVLGDAAQDQHAGLDPSRWTVGALDAGTGNKLWDLADRYPGSRLFLAAGDVVVVTTARPDDESELLHSVVIDARTGAELADVGLTHDSCATDGERLIACTTKAGSQRQLAVFDVENRQLTRSPLSVPSGHPVGVWNDHIFLEDVAVDRAGIVISDELPGRFLAISDDVAVFRTDLNRYAAFHIDT